MTKLFGKWEFVKNILPDQSIYALNNLNISEHNTEVIQISGTWNWYSFIKPGILSFELTYEIQSSWIRQSVNELLKKNYL